MGNLAEFGHRFEHVGVLIAGDTNRDVACPKAADDPVWLAGAEAGIGHIADIDRPSFTASDDHGFHLLHRAKLAERADHIPTFAFPEVTAGGVLVLPGERRPQVVDGQLACREFLGVDDHLQLIVATANKVGAGDAFNTLQPAFDFVLGHPPHRLDVDRRRHEMSDLGVLLGKFVEAEELEVWRATGENPLEIGGELGVLLGGGGYGVAIRWGLAEHQPRDRAVVGIGGLDHRPVGVDRPVADLLHPGVGFHQHLVHVDANPKLERDLTDGVAAGAGEFG